MLVSTVLELAWVDDDLSDRPSRRLSVESFRADGDIRALLLGRTGTLADRRAGD